LFLAASYQNSVYHTDESIDGDAASSDGLENLADGDEDVWQLSARSSYKLNRNNYLEAQISLLTFESELREDFDRTRVELGWRTQL
jgi:hypothetical protein